MISFSQLLQNDLEIYKKHFGLIAGYIAWLLLPYAGMVLFTLPKSNSFLELIIFACSVVQAILGLWLGIFIPIVVREIVSKNEKISLVTLQSRAWKILPSVLFVAILEAAVIAGGLIMLIIPGLIFWVWFALSQMAAILDDKKGVAALSYSRELTRGKFWPLAGRLIGGPVIFGLAAALIASILIGLFALASGTSLDTLTGVTPPLWADIISTIIETFSLPFFLIYFTLLYLDLIKTPSTP